MKGVLLFFLMVSFISCDDKKEPVSSPKGYDLNSPVTVKLPLELDEISGLSFYAKDKSIFAINDEKGQLYKITPFPALQVRHWKFSSKADYEDIVLKDSTFYILQSRGVISVVNFYAGDTISTIDVPFPFPGKMEFETLYYDAKIDRLQLLCKNCEEDKKRKITVFTFDPNTNLFDDSAKVFDVSSVFDAMGDKSFHLRASAAAIHPLTGELYVISAINKLLLVFDKHHKISSFHKLDAIFKQPEGLTFSDNGTLVISNEAADAGPANLMMFNYNK
jgi:uncharacterized protein YjiK